MNIRNFHLEVILPANHGPISSGPIIIRARCAPLSPASGFPVSRSQQVIHETSGLALFCGRSFSPRTNIEDLYQKRECHGKIDVALGDVFSETFSKQHHPDEQEK